MAEYCGPDDRRTRYEEASLRSLERIARLPYLQRLAVVAARRSFITAERSAGRGPERLSDYKAACEAYAAVVGETDGVTAEFLWYYGKALLRAGRPAEAVPVLERSLARFEAELGEVNAAGVLNALARAYLDLGRYGEALPFAERAEAAIIRGWGEDTSPRAAVTFNVAFLRNRTGDAAGAEAAARTAADVYRRCGVSYTGWRVRSELELGKSLLVQGRPEEAAAVFAAALADAESVPADDGAGLPRFLAEAYGDYALALERVDLPAAADRMASKAEQYRSGSNVPK